MEDRNVIEEKLKELEVEFPDEEVLDGLDEREITVTLQDVMNSFYREQKELLGNDVPFNPKAKFQMFFLDWYCAKKSYQKGSANMSEKEEKVYRFLEAFDAFFQDVSYYFDLQVEVQKKLGTTEKAEGENNYDNATELAKMNQRWAQVISLLQEEPEGTAAKGMKKLLGVIDALEVKHPVGSIREFVNGARSQASVLRILSKIDGGVVLCPSIEDDEEITVWDVHSNADLVFVIKKKGETRVVCVDAKSTTQPRPEFDLVDAPSVKRQAGNQRKIIRSIKQKIDIGDPTEFYYARISMPTGAESRDSLGKLLDEQLEEALIRSFKANFGLGREK